MQATEPHWHCGLRLRLSLVSANQERVKPEPPSRSMQERESKSNQFIHAGPGVTQRRTSGRNPRIPARLRSGAKLRPFAHAWRICAHLRARFAYPNVCTPSESTWHWQWTDQIECEEAKKIQKKIPAAGRIGSRLSLLSYIYRAQ
eukprot:1360437-Rhodomonas_salina.3